jgi:hypothetical protein
MELLWPTRRFAVIWNWCLLEILWSTISAILNFCDLELLWLRTTAIHYCYELELLRYRFAVTFNSLSFSSHSFALKCFTYPIQKNSVTHTILDMFYAILVCMHIYTLFMRFRIPPELSNPQCRIPSLVLRHRASTFVWRILSSLCRST